MRLRAKIVKGVIYARKSFLLRRSHHRCFGGTGGCTSASGGACDMALRAYGFNHIALPLGRSILGASSRYYI